MTNHKSCLGVLGVLVGMVVTSPMNGQILHPSGPLPSFEVATIKPWKPSFRPLNTPVPIKMDPVHRVRHQQTDRVHFIGQIDLLIMDAYNLPIGSERQILKGPKWVNSEADRYEIEAKIDGGLYAAMQRMTPDQQQEQVSLMEQSLLAERFHLNVHFEVQGDSPVYALVVAKGGLKLAPARDEDSTMVESRRNEITAHAVTVKQFARSPLWTPIGNRLVVDQTGLTGTYDFTLKWRPDSMEEADASPNADDLPPLFDAIREQLGLEGVMDLHLSRVFAGCDFVFSMEGWGRFGRCIRRT